MTHAIYLLFNWCFSMVDHLEFFEREKIVVGKKKGGNLHIPRRCSRFVGDGRKRPRRRVLKRRDNGKRGEVRKKRKTGRTWPSLDILSIFRFPSRTWRDSNVTGEETRIFLLIRRSVFEEKSRLSRKMSNVSPEICVYK